MSQLALCGLPCDRSVQKSLEVQHPLYSETFLLLYFNQMPPFYDLHCAIPTEAFFLISTGINSSITLVPLTFQWCSFLLYEYSCHALMFFNQNTCSTTWFSFCESSSLFIFYILVNMAYYISSVIKLKRDGHPLFEALGRSTAMNNSTSQTQLWCVVVERMHARACVCVHVYCFVWLR